MNHSARRLSYAFLCSIPLLDLVIVGVRAFRVPGVYQAVGGLLFVAIVVAAWILGARQIRAGAEAEQRLALAGGLLLAPWALVSLLWVGLATPWEATPAENVMRYLVLLVGSFAVAGGFVVLSEALRETGERFYSALGFAANMLAGPAYLIWITLQVGGWSAKVHAGQIPPALVSLDGVLDVLLFVACVLTYFATAAFAASFGRTRWLGRGATRAYVTVNFVALLFIVMRGMAFPDPTALSTAWYTGPGFIAGIPAVPWIMPFLLGVVLLRRAGDEQRRG
ncbi:MAG: hypothetical protein ACR2L2_08750 [Acidobacteriota bacterium]